MHKAKKSLGLKNVNVFTRAKKALGQNFLKSQTMLRKMVDTGEVSKSDVVLEIGPGKGALTEKLLEKAGRVIAVEKDRELFEFLRTKLEKEIKANTLVLVHEDILKFNINDVELLRQGLKSCLKSYKVIANIPYNITGAILEKFLTAEHQPEMMVLMVQYEVAKRILGKQFLPSLRSNLGKNFGKNNPIGKTYGVGKESILSISVKAYGEPKIIMKVPAKYFSPIPKVDSAILAIKDISRKLFIENKVSEEKFWQLVHAGFAHKRKKLFSNLRCILQVSALSAKTPPAGKAPQGESLRSFLGNKRAEELSLADWINLTKTIYQQ